MDLAGDWLQAVQASRRGSHHSDHLAAPSPNGLLASPQTWQPSGESPFLRQANELNASLKAMHTFLSEHYYEYVTAFGHLTSEAPPMSEAEKDAVDAEATSFMTSCAQGIEALRYLLRKQQEQQLAQVQHRSSSGGSAAGWDEEADNRIRPDSKLAHQHAAVTYLFERLKAVTALVEAMQGERYKQVTQSKRRFYAGPTDLPAAPAAPRTQPAPLKRSAEEMEEEKALSFAFQEVYGAAPLGELEPSDGGPEWEAHLGKHQQQMLEQENRDLVASLQNELDDVMRVEQKMAEISGLLNLFTSKVVEQQSEVEHIYDAAITVNEQVQKGGQHLEKAVERSGGFRKFYVIFMLGASCCLLFLHWYNP